MTNENIVYWPLKLGSEFSIFFALALIVKGVTEEDLVLIDVDFFADSFDENDIVIARFLFRALIKSI